MNNDTPTNQTPGLNNQSNKIKSASSAIPINQQSAQSQGPMRLSGSGMKVIQPVSSDLSSSDATPNFPVASNASRAQAQQQITSERSPSVSTPEPTNPESVQQSSSIYPDYTHKTSTGDTKPDASLPSENLSSLPEKTKFLTAVIWLIGAFIAIPAALSLFGTVRILSYGIGGGYGVWDTLIDILYVIVGVGIVLRREMARIVYVVLAVIGLLLSVYGTSVYVKNLHSVNNVQSQAIANIQKQISYEEKNTSLPSTERAQLVQSLQKELTNDKKEQSSLSLLNLIPDYLIALVPLIFLTRPVVKALFD